ncbi:hypothetical protein AGABI2DRAFT_194077 [Agaricus bisporus var. bisporus H97]|uniref:hypothetical protein n=1 Tax=Agaricus bisporus var. bisporus (strain H97 / ATCC MYA-4626 / FGSC 10389) TaxID=936046 RepID=UPI00029F5689|nr:hypothetical protein AGABI2DRAFT_194077 [Agaricus bisporus var. bisporus H97]EKV44977.1 hypothetical protein AGABI2DRAFT_194077 [Agaricus bisporus var. bisporus H97]
MNNPGITRPLYHFPRPGWDYVTFCVGTDETAELNQDICVEILIPRVPLEHPLQALPMRCKSLTLNGIGMRVADCERLRMMCVEDERIITRYFECIQKPVYLH